MCKSEIQPHPIVSRGTYADNLIPGDPSAAYQLDFGNLDIGGKPKKIFDAQKRFKGKFCISCKLVWCNARPKKKLDLGMTISPLAERGKPQPGRFINKNTRMVNVATQVFFDREALERIRESGQKPIDVIRNIGNCEPR